MATGTSRVVLSKNAMKNESQEALNTEFKNENDVAKNVKKFPLKASASSHNHSK